MIIVKTLNEFLSFIDMAKQQNISYSIIGSEKEGFEGVLGSGKEIISFMVNMPCFVHHSKFLFL